MKTEQLKEVEIPKPVIKLPPMPRFIAVSAWKAQSNRLHWTVDGPFTTPEAAVAEAMLGGMTIESTVRVFEIPTKGEQCL